MGHDSDIDRKKVDAEFDERARRHGDENAVLDAGASATVKRKNVFRDYVTKAIVVKFLRPTSNDVVIDFGCGVGRLSKLLAPKVKAVHAWDRSGEMINVARKTSAGFGNIRYEKIEGDRFPLGDNSAQKFFSFWVLQHVDDNELFNILSEAKRVLATGGTVYLFEQVKKQSTVIGGIHRMRTSDEYKEIARSAGLDFVSDSRVFRFPSYAMSVWTKLSWLPGAALPLLSKVEAMTANHKPEHIEYSTNALVFRKS